MPVTLTDDNTVFPAVTAPVQSDALSTVDIRAGLQAVANRTANTVARIGAVNGIAPLNSTAQVPNANLPFGLSLGIAQADSTGRTPAASVRNGIISDNAGVFGTAGTLYASSSSASYVDIGSASVAVASAAVGDKLRIAASFDFTPSSGNSSVQLVVTDSAGTTSIQELTILASTHPIVTLIGLYTVTHTGTQTVKLQYKSVSGVMSVNGQISITATLVRP